MKKTVLFILVPAAVVLFSGCSIGGGSDAASGNILKSSDGGKSWETKSTVDAKQNIAGVDVLSMAINPNDTKNIYIGTRDNGIFATKNSGEAWEKLNYPPNKVYGLVVDNINPWIVYATGVWQERGKIYKSEDSGASWKEIYTEPANGTVIISLSASVSNPDILYAGTSGNAIFKTTNGGQTWINLFKSTGPVTGIAFDSNDDKTVYFLMQGEGILRTRDGGLNFEDLGKKLEADKLFANIGSFSIVADPHQSGLLYVGADKGVMKSTDFGDSWNMLNILESSKEFFVGAIVINPKNSNEIIYSAAQAIYKSIDGGIQWSTSQLQTSKVVRAIKYDPQDPGIIYAGLRK